MCMGSELSSAEVAAESRRLQCEAVELIRGDGSTGFMALNIDLKVFELYELFLEDVVRELHREHRHPWNPKQVGKTVRAVCLRWEEYHVDERLVQQITDAAANHAVFATDTVRWASQKKMIAAHWARQRATNPRALAADSVTALRSASDKFAQEPISQEKLRYELLPHVRIAFETRTFKAASKDALYNTQYGILDDALECLDALQLREARAPILAFDRTMVEEMKESVKKRANDWMTNVSRRGTRARADTRSHHACAVERILLRPLLTSHEWCCNDALPPRRIIRTACSTARS
jgi:hypothetical protein